ncbi:putative wd-repeat protein [Phaeoacremonium minimum UCRPA7]|uniref:Putative wd-repeat protein n=1 Tax=Phaeoacremonium minimum (strain UCR-PA7) TaxID=1286976 RepID=R8BVD0_PHAM7|nr:putative wd-repeat protein [Phaeoacremonium minimum UCRPA7]EOO03308.1 putative wd-repeat protein [Phaeoacremonium minimum UCRPA7]
MPSLSKLIHRPKKDDAGPAPAANAAEPPSATASETSPAPTVATPMTALKPQSLPEDAGSISSQLWDEAYDDLKSSEADLMTRFEKILSRELALQRAQATGASESAAEKSVSQDNAIPQTNQRGIRQERLNMIIQAGLKKTAKIAKYEGHVKTAIDYVFKLKDIIDMAVSSMPAAAAAWSGISLGLQIFLNPLTSTDANRSGIVYVVTSMKWYYSMSNLILRENINVESAHGRSFSDLRSSLKARVLDLYKAIITYTTKSVVSYYRHQGLEFLRGLVQMNDWDGSLAAVKSAEVALRSDSTEYSTQAMRSTLDELLAVTKSQADDLRSQLGDIHAAIEKQTATQLEWRMEDGDENCLRDLRVVDPRDEIRAIEARKDDLLDDAYKWVLDNSEYKKFVNWDAEDDQQTRMLWIRGDAGTGKTMLMMGILRELELRAKRSGDTTTSYFFIQATDAKLSNATTILRGLVWLLLDQRRSLISHIRDKYKTAGKVLFEDKNAFFALSSALKSILDDETTPRIVLAVDALDECDEQSKPGLPDLVDLLAEVSRGSSRVKILLSSRRGRAALDTKLNSLEEPKRVSLELDAALLTEPVNAYINHKVSELGQKGYGLDIQSSVVEILRNKANGTFLWVALVCKELEEVEDYDALEVLTEMPPGLKELYERMMDMINRLKRSDPGFCKAILAAVMSAFRPLRLEEVGLQAGLRPNVPATTIVKKCGSFLTVRDNTVYFVHQSAKDYLVDEIYHGDIVGEHVKMTERAIDVLELTLRRNIEVCSSVLV